MTKKRVPGVSSGGYRVTLDVSPQVTLCVDMIVGTYSDMVWPEQKIQKLQIASAASVSRFPGRSTCDHPVTIGFDRRVLVSCFGVTITLSPETYELRVLPTRQCFLVQPLYLVPV